MKKVIIFLILLFIPFVVNATDECDNKNISLEKVEFGKTNGNAVELNDAKIENQVVKFDINFSKLDDSVEYKVLIKNNSDEDYQIDQNSIKSESENISYVINNGEPMVLGAKEEKKVSILVKYDKKVSEASFVNNVYDTNNIMTFNLVNNQQDNPLTKTSTIIAIVMVLLAAVVLVIAFYIKSKKIIPLALVFLLVPFVVNALCKMTINTDSHFVIDKYPNKRCYFDGELTKGAEYTNGQYVYRYLEEGTASIPFSERFKDIDEGWSMRLIDRDSTDPVTTEMCVYVNDIPVKSIAYAFTYSDAESIDLSSFNTTNIVNMMGTFRDLGVKELDLSYLDTSNVKNMWGMFADNTTLESLDLRPLDTSNVEDMTFMFSGWKKDLDVSMLDTRKVKSMYQMFIDAEIENLDLSAWDTSSLENMMQMFSAFKGEINFGNFNTSNVTNMEKLFSHAKIANLDVSSFDTRKVTNMTTMFENFEADTLDISNFKIDSLETVHGMFIWSTVRVIDMSGMTTSKLRKSTNMFAECENLETIYASPDFDSSVLENPVGQNNFTSNTKLVGQNGTVCSNVSGENDLLYMRIDGGPSAPGCFSAK